MTHLCACLQCERGVPHHACLCSSNARVDAGRHLPSCSPCYQSTVSTVRPLIIQTSEAYAHAETVSTALSRLAITASLFFSTAALIDANSISLALASSLECAPVSPKRS